MTAATIAAARGASGEVQARDGGSYSCAGVGCRLWNSNWLARLEYLHYDFGKSAGVYQGFDDPPFGLEITRQTNSGRLTADVIRAGIDYKFD